jgi:hypothetical protein
MLSWGQCKYRQEKCTKLRGNDFFIFLFVEQAYLAITANWDRKS